VVWHESFSTASRVGVVATLKGWMGAECAILGTEIRGDRIGQRNFMVVYCLLLLLHSVATDF